MWKPIWEPGHLDARDIANLPETDTARLIAELGKLRYRTVFLVAFNVSRFLLPYASLAFLLHDINGTLIPLGNLDFNLVFPVIFVPFLVLWIVYSSRFTDKHRRYLLLDWANDA